MAKENLKIKIKEYLIKNFNKLKINSKEIVKGDVFIALRGKNFHGNIFIKEAINNGAKFIITDKKFKSREFNNILKVKDNIKYLKEIACKKRSLYKGKIIGITGSVGKTTTKEYIRFLLSASLKGKVSASIKSYNNLLGVLLSLVNLKLKTHFSIFEIGTNNFGEIKILTSLILPEQVIITNINPTHLDNFKNTRNIAIEKSDIFNPKYNPKIKLAILPNSNNDELYMNILAKKNNIQNIITFGEKSDSDYYLKKIEKNKNNIIYRTPKIEFKIKNQYFLQHEVMNIILPLIIFDYNNLSLNNFRSNIRKMPRIFGRGSHHNIYLNNKLVKLINESYNASPISMINAINYFIKIKLNNNQRKVLILGEMLELGYSSFKFHSKIANYAVSKFAGLIIFSGRKYKNIFSNFPTASKKIFYFSNEFKIIQFLNNIIQKNDIILAKGSNSSNVNSLVNTLLKKERKD